MIMHAIIYKLFSNMTVIVKITKEFTSTFIYPQFDKSVFFKQKIYDILRIGCLAFHKHNNGTNSNTGIGQ